LAFINGSEFWAPEGPTNRKKTLSLGVETMPTSSWYMLGESGGDTVILQVALALAAFLIFKGMKLGGVTNRSMPLGK
jgi:hypothetical protein